MNKKNATILGGDVVEVAKRLLGSYLVRTVDGRRMVGKIVETEAYHQADAASHSYRGKTPRTEIMFGPAGYAYVYFTYGMHYCMNVVTGSEGEGSAVLIRALEPIEGVDMIRKNRPGITDISLMNGPAKLCKAFGIDKTFNGHDLANPPLQLVLRPSVSPREIAVTMRVGITRDRERPWRFYIKGSNYISRP